MTANETPARDRILYIADGPLPTGFGTVTQRLVERMVSARQDADHAMLAVGCKDELACPTDFPCRILAANPAGSDPFGYRRLPVIIQKYQPTIVYLNSDLVPCALYAQIIVQVCGFLKIPVPKIVAYVATDGPIGESKSLMVLLQYARMVLWTNYGVKMVRECIQGLGENPDEYLNRLSVNPLTVDTETFKPPTSKKAAREALRLMLSNLEINAPVTDDSFIVNLTNRNQQRKLLGTAFRYLEPLLREDKNMILMYRCALKDLGGDFYPWVRAAGLQNQVIVLDRPNQTLGALTLTETAVQYQASDCYASVSLTEGFGLCEHEAALCGLPVVLTAHTVRPELWDGAGLLLEPATEILAPAFAQSPGWLPRASDMQAAIRQLKNDPKFREAAGRACRERALSLGTWDDVARHFVSIFSMPKPEPVSKVWTAVMETGVLK